MNVLPTPIPSTAAATAVGSEVGASLPALPPTRDVVSADECSNLSGEREQRSPFFGAQKSGLYGGKW